MFGTKSVVASVFALALYALPAQAVTVYDDPTVRLLTDGFVFAASAGGGIVGTPALPSGGFTFTYHFSYLPPPTLLAVETTTNNIIGSAYNITGFLVEWIKDAGAVLLNSYAGGTANNSLSLPSAGLYTLKLTGTATGSAGGFFNLTVAADCAPGGACAPGDTPLPGAVVLFGSVLAGGVGGLQIMRRRRKAQVA